MLEKCLGCGKMIDTGLEGVDIKGRLMCMECQDEDYVPVQVFDEVVLQLGQEQAKNHALEQEVKRLGIKTARGDEYCDVCGRGGDGT